jgi:hypothetical protein
MNKKSRQILEQMIQKISESDSPFSLKPKLQPESLPQQIKRADRMIAHLMIQIAHTQGKGILQIDDQRPIPGNIDIHIRSICIGDFVIPSGSSLLVLMKGVFEEDRYRWLMGPILLSGLGRCNKCGFTGANFVSSKTSPGYADGEEARRSEDVQALETTLVRKWDTLIGQGVFDPVLLGIAKLSQRIGGGLDTYRLVVNALYSENQTPRHVLPLARIGLRKVFLSQDGVKAYWSRWERARELKISADYHVIATTPCSACGGFGGQLQEGAQG